MQIGFFGNTPIDQPTNSITAATLVAGVGGVQADTSTFGGYTIGQLTQALINLGYLESV